MAPLICWSRLAPTVGSLVSCTRPVPSAAVLFSPELMHKRCVAAAASDEKVTYTIPYQFKTHQIDPPSQDVETTKSELLGIFTQMYRMRRMEIEIEALYRSKLVRGFCHLYDGQEAVCVGMEAALTYDDAIITAYRDHCTHIGRGGTVFEVFSELLGREAGCSQGKGGSMHLYKKEHNFYGGNGIVGAQVPLGVGIAFGQKYNKLPNVTAAIYGDGAANQGQLFEALNIAALWKLPCLLVCENNLYGMGTSIKRSAKSTAYYTRGDYVPGIKVDGMDALAVKQAIKFAKEYAIQNGPLMIEMDTYRYKGHSVTDPATYRERSEVSKFRKERDPIERVRQLILRLDLAPDEELQAIYKEVKQEVADDVDRAKAGSQPEASLLNAHIHVSMPSGFQAYAPDRRQRRPPYSTF